MSGKKKNPEADEIHELSDISTKEVSIVDRAANKRKFLIVKREEGAMANKEVKKADATTVEVGGVPGSESNTLPAGAGADSSLYGASSIAIEGESVPPPVNSAEVLGMDEDSTGAELTAFPTTEKTAQVAITDQAPSAGGFSSNVVTQMNTVMKSLQEVEKLEDAGAIKTGLAKAIEDLGGAVSSITEVEKKGAKMARSRMEAMEKAVDQLTKLVKELKGMGVAENNDTGARKNPEGTAPASGVSKQEVSKSSTAFGIEGIETKVNQMDQSLAEMNKNIAKMAEAFNAVTRVVKAQGSELQKVSKNVGASNSVPVEVEGKPSMEDVDWPIDLASIPSKESVQKRGISFMDD